MADTLQEIEKKYNKSLKANASGLRYSVIREGSGKSVNRGARVQVHYSGWLVDGTPFDSSVERDEAFEFRVGKQEVIPGWDEAVLEMKVGEIRLLILPPQLAYGDEDMDIIPPNSTLIFQVELLASRN